MFGSFRLGRRAVTALSLLGAAVIVGLSLLLLRASPPSSVTLDGDSYSLQAEEDAQIEAFLTACGFAAEGCVSDRQVTVPKHWNDVYDAYQALQEAQGLTLVPYKGRQARELVYAGADSGDYAVLLVAGDRIIAAHRSTMVQGDAMRPLIG